MGGDADKPGLPEKLAVVEMVEGEGEAPTIAVSDPALQAPPPQAQGNRMKAELDDCVWPAVG